MKTFLEHVAKDMMSKYDGELADIAVVFPNKRAALFLNKALVSLSDRPVWSPAYITISDLFRSHTQLQVADPIKTVCDLHKSFVAVTGKEETLDKFYGWGQLLLSDFDDIDKNDADAAKVFANLTDLHEYDDISYLTDEQKEVIRRFFSNFNDDDSKLQRRFIELWSKLHDVYADFRDRLRRQGLAYEGMLYNEVANDPNIEFRYKKYLFVGFNVLQEVERKLFLRLKKEGKAAFYWNFDKYYTINKEQRIEGNEAGTYIRKYLDIFPNELDVKDGEIYDNFSKLKDVTFVSAPTENIQARYVTEWLRTGRRVADGSKTAIVLCDEGLLQNVVHCIPDEVTEVNVTTGYPLRQTPVASLVTMMFRLLFSGYASKQDALRLNHVNPLLRHPYSKYISREASALHKELNDNKMFYVRRSELRRDEGLSLLFGDVVFSGGGNQAIVTWMKSVVRLVAVNGNGNADQLFQESLFRAYTLLNRLSALIDGGDLDVDKVTLQRFVTQLFNATTIPFHGEPAAGLQIMGVLETRNIDFDHVLLLSCNEGNMPKGVDDSSFIPHSLRKAYGLTTIDNKVAIYSYYFYSMLQRAKDVTILYNNSTEGYKTGEMSRFMLQLMVESGIDIKRMSLQAGQIPSAYDIDAVEKDQDVMARLQSIETLSPTAIIKYMRCPMQFFYNYVAGIKEPDTGDDDEIDSRMFGNIFHKAAQLMYDKLPHRIMSVEPVDKLLKNKNVVSAVVDQAISEELFNMPEGSTRHPELNGLQLINREVIIKYLMKLLHIDRKLVPFGILAHEVEVSGMFDIETSRGKLSIKAGGRIDRLDEVDIGTSEHRLRVVDYKTGNRMAKDVKDIAEIFDAGNMPTKHTDYIFQTFFYSLLESKADNVNNPGRLAVSPALLFIQHAGKEDYSPVLTVGNVPVTDIMQQHGEEFEQLLKEKITEIYEPALPFTPVEDRTVCHTCPYKELCGR